MTTLTKEARGPFVYSMFDGDALNLEFAKFAIEGDENLIFKILEPDVLTKIRLFGRARRCFAVFEVSAREGERLSEWSARAESVFHACHRNAGIASPDTVKGYLCRGWWVGGWLVGWVGELSLVIMNHFEKNEALNCQINSPTEDSK